MPKISSQGRFIIRTSLVTGSTIAAFVGAQSLAALDLSQQNDIVVSDFTAEPVGDVTLVEQPVTPSIQQAEPSLDIRAVEPNIVILRRSDGSSVNPTTVQTSTTTTALQPPNAVVVQPPNPVVVQQTSPAVVQQTTAARPVTRSTR